MSLIDEAYKKAIVVLEHCAKDTGFYASGLAGGYEATWARDSMIASLGASLVEEKFKPVFKKSLELLTNNQSDSGLIPNAVGSWNEERQSDVTFNSIDAPLWYIIGHHVYKEAYNDNLLMEKYKSNILKAYEWLTYQDPNNDRLLVQQPTTDWQDAFPHKYGRVISTQALYYAALKTLNQKERAEHLKNVVNGETENYLSLYSPELGYYKPWRWKTHNAFSEEGEWFDTFGNLMAIVTGLATPEIAIKILEFIDNQKINRPFPCQTIYPPLGPGDKEWHDYFEDCEARTAYEYANAGIWPYIGGFYVAALVKIQEFKKAKEELEILAEANHRVREDISDSVLDNEWGFQEWLHGQTGEPIGGSSPYQAWSAGMYIFAYECVKNEKVLYF